MPIIHAMVIDRSSILGMISEGVIMPWVLLALKLLLQTDRLKLLWFFWGWERERDEILDLIR